MSEDYSPTCPFGCGSQGTLSAMGMDYDCGSIHHVAGPWQSLSCEIDCAKLKIERYKIAEAEWERKDKLQTEMIQMLTLQHAEAKEMAASARRIVKTTAAAATHMIERVAKEIAQWRKVLQNKLMGPEPFEDWILELEFEMKHLEETLRPAQPAEKKEKTA